MLDRLQGASLAVCLSAAALGGCSDRLQTTAGPLTTAVADSVEYVPLGPEAECGAAAPTVAPCRARVPWRETDVRARLRAGGPPVWRTGDTLTFAVEQDARTVRMCCTVVLPMSRFRGTSLWVLSVRVPRVDEAAFGYGFYPDRSAFRYDRMQVWRGPDAPPAMPVAAELRGTVRTDTLDSPALGGRRAVTVYLPPGHDAASGDRVVYMADGEQTESFARTLEPQILAGAVPPVAIVGLHSGPNRNGEYAGAPGGIDRAGRKRFAPESPPYAAHERFFVDEVVPWAERTYGVSRERSRRAVFGYSSGAHFAAAMALRHPDLFGASLPFSCGVTGDGFPGVPLPDGPRPQFFFVTGLFDIPEFVAGGRALAGRLQEDGFEVVSEDHVAGHDPLMWREAFPDAVRRAFAR